MCMGEQGWRGETPANAWPSLTPRPTCMFLMIAVFFFYFFPFWGGGVRIAFCLWLQFLRNGNCIDACREGDESVGEGSDGRECQ